MTGLTVLVTGVTGTFGAAFVRYALDQGAARVIGLSRGEHRQAALVRLMADPRLECWIGDVRDRDRLHWAFRAQPDVVVHSAALKRIEVCERDPDEALKTNVEGTRHVVQEAMLANIPKVLVLSSDKATSPETTYGRTKAQAEDLALGQNAFRGRGRTRISVVRWGNIVGSQGSFLEDIYRARQHGTALTLTDLAATRFWFGLEDAVAFAAQVLARMQGAEIFIPKLVSARVLDLVKAIAPDAPLTVTGMRGAEKLHEAMINATEARYAWELPDCYVLLPKAGQWWSPDPPEDAVLVPEGFTYLSSDHPTSVEAVFS
jgi:UDP-N-acetylglucosamine 4,6-dehydratase